MQIVKGLREGGLGSADSRGVRGVTEMIRDEVRMQRGKDVRRMRESREHRRGGEGCAEAAGGAAQVEVGLSRLPSKLRVNSVNKHGEG